MRALEGRVALVTGASRGIGKGCALELGAAGASVYVTARTLEPSGAPLPGTLGETVRELEQLGGRGVALACDLRDDAQLQGVFERIREEQGRLDVLVHTAFVDPGIAAELPFWESPLGWYDDMLDVGTRAAYAAAYFAAPLMVSQGSGLIVNVSSLGAAHYYRHVAYGMGKAALDKLSRDAARDLRAHGTAVVSIWPYYVKTEGLLKLIADGADIPLKGAESQRFVGRGVVALASDPQVMERSGQAWTSRELADAYAFVDVDGELPDGSPVPARRRSGPPARG